mgnify:CR=1 FL=1
MAEVRSKRAVYFTCSTGKQGDGKSPAIEFRVDSPWKPGRSKNKYKDRVVKVQKTAIG